MASAPARRRTFQVSEVHEGLAPSSALPLAQHQPRRTAPAARERVARLDRAPVGQIQQLVARVEDPVLIVLAVHRAQAHVHEALAADQAGHRQVGHAQGQDVDLAGGRPRRHRIDHRHAGRDRLRLGGWHAGRGGHHQRSSHRTHQHPPQPGWIDESAMLQVRHE
jgi:hypothetical protein